MMSTLPPFQTLQAFDAAARMLSFTAAARALNISQPAVSQQIKFLEERLKVVLFYRLPLRLELTPEGEIMAKAVSEAIQALRRGTDALAGGNVYRDLIIAVTPSLGARWLVPRLQRLRLATPEIDISIVPAFTPSDMERVEADIGVLYGPGRWSGWRCEPLHRETLFPVANPKLTYGAKFEIPDAIFSYTLLRDADVQHDCWPIWLMAEGAKNRSVDRGPKFDNLSDTIEAAIGGQGIALARSLLVEDSLSAGTLVRLYPNRVPAEHAIHLVWGKRVRNQQAAHEVRDWLVEELSN